MLLTSCWLWMPLCLVPLNCHISNKQKSWMRPICIEILVLMFTNFGSFHSLRPRFKISLFFYTAFLPYWHNLVGNAVLYDQTSPNASFWHAIADYWINSAINRWPACNQLCIKIETEKFFYMHLVINNLEFTGTGYVHVVNSECSVYLFFLVFFLSISPFKYSDTILYR